MDSAPRDATLPSLDRIHGHATIITVAVNKRIDDRMRLIPCPTSLRNHDVAWGKVIERIFS